MTGEQEAAIVLGFHTDVAARLTDQGRVMGRHKQELLQQRETELAESLEQASISRGSRRINDKANIQSTTFEERQKLYLQREALRKDQLLQEQQTASSAWFRPQICPKSDRIVAVQRPEVLLESRELQAERLSGDGGVEERRRQRAAELYGFSFAPSIDPLSRALGRASSLEELVANERGVRRREEVRRRVEEETMGGVTFQPRINELSKQLVEGGYDSGWAQGAQAQGGWAGGCPLYSLEQPPLPEYTHQRGRINLLEPERMARDIRQHEQERQEHRRSELIAREIEELRECSFRPDLNTSRSSLAKVQRDSGPVVVRGLGRHLELMHLTARQKEQQRQREVEVFTVRNVENFRRPEDGSTVVE
ncbi:hypothetical protein B484DRAFT_442617, partial [Ochromonadaceae sp. CCMP2298]